jgi:DNA-binding NtrC family response regulator
VGDIPLPMQVKLLRLLESGTYRRVGSAELRRSDVRVVAATHRDLLTMVAQGQFRQDLYFRLSVFPIPLPPLRERADDLPLLVPSLLARVAPGRRLQLASAAMAVLQAHPFPGNVRELRNVLERAALMTDGDEIEADVLQQALGAARPPAASWPALLGAPPAALPPAPTPPTPRQALQAALASHRGTRAELAQALGISLRTLHRRLRELEADSR